MSLQKLPIGIQTFSKIREENFLYIDKTEQIHRLITSGDYYFLSRPRRFGKSLTLSTIKSIYLGQREFFDGLWIADQWDWSQTNPVLHMSFSGIGYQSLGLEGAITAELHDLAAQLDIVLEEQDMARLFRELIRKLSVQNKVVILIDEYDKPLIDYLEDVEQARENQRILKSFYSVIKDSDPYIELLLLTGISKFSKVSIFSDLNNLNDITLDRLFSDLTGYTQDEIENAFAPYIKNSAELLELDKTELLAQLKYRYNGYSWDGKTHVYNPFSILNFFSKADFRNYWFETGTPTFLLKLMRAQNIIKLDNLTIAERTFSSYDIEHLEALPILFQTGYLTIKERKEFGQYTLDYPNAEVKESLLEYIISDLRHLHMSVGMTTPMVIQLYQAFAADNIDEVIALIKSIFKNIPSQIFINEAEAYYHSLIYLVFLYLGQYVESEVNTNNGRLDCVVQTETHIYIIEFKLDKSADAAIQQIKERGYADKYGADPRPKVLLGINFSRSEKSVDDWQVETIT